MIRSLQSTTLFLAVFALLCSCSCVLPSSVHAQETVKGTFYPDPTAQFALLNSFFVPAKNEATLTYTLIPDPMAGDAQLVAFIPVDATAAHAFYESVLNNPAITCSQKVNYAQTVTSISLLEPGMVSTFIMGNDTTWIIAITNCQTDLATASAVPVAPLSTSVAFIALEQYQLDVSTMFVDVTSDASSPSSHYWLYRGLIIGGSSFVLILCCIGVVLWIRRRRSGVNSLDDDLAFGTGYSPAPM